VAVVNVVLWLRVSSIVSVLFAAGHTLGGRRAWSPVGESDVLAAMRTYRFDVQGMSRSYLDFYRGFGFSLSVFLLLQGVVLWQLCAIARTHPALVRPIIGSFAVASVVGALITWAFIFPVPAVFSAVLSACLVLAFFAAR
jgi:hypothetical protein